MSIDEKLFRRTLGCCPTGVSIITTTSKHGDPIGVTIGSFASLSLDPPLVLFCLDNANASLGAFLEKGAFAVNMLSHEQRDLSNRFGSRSGLGWQNLEFDRWDEDLPRLRGCLGHLLCRIVNVVDGGDHKIFIGRVEQAASEEAGEPLLHFRGAYRVLEQPVRAE